MCILDPANQSWGITYSRLGQGPPSLGNQELEIRECGAGADIVRPPPPPNNNNKEIKQEGRNAETVIGMEFLLGVIKMF